MKNVFYKINSRCFSKTKEDLVSKIHKHNINTVTMGFPDLYGRFVGKKFDSDYFVDKALKNGSNACNYLLSCDMGHNPLPTTQISSYERGFGDFTMKADYNSIKEINYINDSRQLLVFSDLYHTESSNPITHAPRHLLKQSIEQLKLLGFTCEVQADLNFTVLNEKHKKIHDNGYSQIQAITEHSNMYHTLYKQNFEEFFSKLKSSLKFSNINIERLAGDKAPGQYKISLSLNDPVDFGDALTLFKLCAKKIADDSDKTITFMAKVREDWPGNNMNLKLIIKDSKGNNVLQGVKLCPTNGLTYANSQAENSLGGILTHLKDFLVFYAPTINSYKRLKEPNLISNWNRVGYMQTDCGVNILNEDNLEKILFTIPGSDANIYFVLFSLLHSIRSGLENKINLKTAMNDHKESKLPINLYAANRDFLKSEFVRQILGDEVHQHFNVFYNFEYSDFMNQVDDWELNRYLYNI